MNTLENKNINENTTLMLDMDGTILDLAYDSHIWLKLIPSIYADNMNISIDDASSILQKKVSKMGSSLKWYCIDHWSELLGIDILRVHELEKDKIRYLPGAESFLKKVIKTEIRVILVTNSHRDTLNLKIRETGLDKYFNDIYISHDFDAPKEDQLFWKRFQSVENFEKNKTIFVDDNVSVLKSAKKFGLGSLIQILYPDSDSAEIKKSQFMGIHNLKQLLI